MTKLTADPKMCLSGQDAEIQRRCEKILNETLSLKDIKFSIGLLMDFFLKRIKFNKYVFKVISIQ